jgi:MoaA/NifB/PqqE/SkfB family radical SAM enzyme
MKFLSAKEKVSFFTLAIKNLTYISGSRNLSPPITMWRLTKRCNLKCKHCSHHLNRDKINQEKLIEIAHKIAASNTMVVSLTGGEPLLVPNIKEIITILKNAGKKIMLNTNGYNLEQFNDFLMESKVDYIAVSFDGFNEKTHDQIRGKEGSFKAALDSIKYIKANRKGNKPHLAVRAVVMKDNFRSMQAYAEFFEPLVDEVKFQPIHDYQGYDEVVDKDVLFKGEQSLLEEEFNGAMKGLIESNPSFRNDYHRHFQKFIFHPYEMEAIAVNHCLPVWFIFFIILEDGSCKTCTKLIGNIQDAGVEEIWNGKERLSFLTALAHEGRCKMPCWLTCTGAGQSWQGNTIKKMLQLRKLEGSELADFKLTPNFTGMSTSTEPIEI